MRDLEDIVIDIASIVTSCRPGELMTIKKVEEGFRAIYGTHIPYFDYNFSSVEKLLEGFPNYFKFSIADGLLIIRTNVKNNITELISKEKKPKIQTTQSNCLFKKHRRREMKIDAELPVICQKSIVELFNNYKKPIRKDDFLNLFESSCGYELKYLDYGFVNIDHLFQEMDGKLWVCGKNHMLYQLQKEEKSIYDYVREILRNNTGFTLATIQEYILQVSQYRICDLMKNEGFVNFIDVIYDAAKKKMLNYDFQFIYPFSERCGTAPIQSSIFPPGVNRIRFLSIKSPSDFFFQIETDNIESVDNRLFELSSELELLSMFGQHKLCAVEYDSMWYRAKIIDLCQGSNHSDNNEYHTDGHDLHNNMNGYGYHSNHVSSFNESVRLRFIDHPIELENGIEIGLPTDRLRFLPRELETVPSYIHRGSLAYVKPIAGGCKWNREACDRFIELVTDSTCIYQAFLVGLSDRLATIDVVGRHCHGERVSIFSELARNEMAIVEI